MEKVVKAEILEALVDTLKHDQFKDGFIRKLNKNVNIPIINEKTEAKIMDYLYDMLVEHVVEVTDKM
jgi:hypothetical protein